MEDEKWNFLHDLENKPLLIGTVKYEKQKGNYVAGVFQPTKKEIQVIEVKLWYRANDKYAKFHFYGENFDNGYFKSLAQAKRELSKHFIGLKWDRINPMAKYFIKL